MDKEKSSFFLRNTWMLYGIGAAAAIARIGIRFYLTRRIGVEEWIMLFALLCWTGDTFLITVVVEKGTNQVGSVDRSTIPAAEVSARELGSKSFLAAWFFYTTAIWACKAAILIFYKRLTDRSTQRKAVKFAGGVLVVTYLVCMLSVALVCRPFKGNWTVFPDPGPACTEGRHFVWIVGVFNIITDVMLLAIPMPMLLHLQVNLTRKILLGALFSLGTFVIIATILRIYFTISTNDISNMTFWSMIGTCRVPSINYPANTHLLETATLFIVSNAPGIKSIFTRKKPSHSSGSHNGPHSRSYEMGGSSTGGHTQGHISKLSHTITTHIDGGGDSQERIIGVGADGQMVIHQNITYDVMVERTESPENGSTGTTDAAPRYMVNAIGGKS
ncbi:hypothetical protein EDC01DRAFT_663305 [Geopyxis carbonaria]|nr:hypothetical protein EDC01DRAFT_663305 [Geopyxis carbonaria]